MSEKPELSKKSPYWIPRHRYYELKHFCLQYKSWRKALAALNLVKSESTIKPGEGFSNPTEANAEKRAFYISRIAMIDDAAFETDRVIGDYIVIGVTEGLGHDDLKARLNIPCCKEVYYNYYRKFFYILSEKRQ